jgi:hypothetical protein
VRDLRSRFNSGDQSKTTLVEVLGGYSCETNWSVAACLTAVKAAKEYLAIWPGEYGDKKKKQVLCQR